MLGKWVCFTNKIPVDGIQGCWFAYIEDIGSMF